MGTLAALAFLLSGCAGDAGPRHDFSGGFVGISGGGLGGEGTGRPTP
jgi:hypothetical protein